MISGIKNYIAFILIIALILAFLTASAEADLREGQMLYKQFSLIEAQEPVITQYTFGDNTSLIEKGETLPNFQDWWTAKNDKQATSNIYREKIQLFTKNSARFILNENDSNMVYSPVNIWFYLELLSNITEGNSRKQVLSLLGLDFEGNETMHNEDLDKALYWDDGFSVCRPASSIWISQHTRLSDTLLSKLAGKCHDSVFQGPMGEDIYDEAYRAWLNYQTNGLLEEVVNDLGFGRETTISLSTTLYFRSSWSLPFVKDETYTDVFYSARGETTANFMRKEQGEGTFYRGDCFSSVIMDLLDGSYSVFILPDSGKSVNEVLQSEELFDFFFTGKEWSNGKKGRIRTLVPKLDILSATSIKDTLIRMGVTDIFNFEKAEFSSDILSDDDLKLIPMDQYSRLIMNEEGVEAAAMIVSDSTSFRILNEEEIDFVLNRPFLFAVFSETIIPLFIGVYNGT